MNSNYDENNDDNEWETISSTDTRYLEINGKMIDPHNNILFKSIVEVESQEFDSLTLFIKFPQSNRHQKVTFVSCDYKHLTQYSERFSAVYQYSFQPENFKTSQFIEINSIVNIEPIPYDFPIPKTFYPIDNSNYSESPSILEYLKPDDQVPVGGTDLSFIANNITKEAKYLWSATKAIINWINNTIFYEPDTSQNYKTIENILTTHRGTCADFVHLSIAILREAGIPARAVQGIVGQPNIKTGKMQWITHSWIEIFDATYNWLPIDPTTKPPLYAKLSPYYIKIFSANNCLVPYHVIQVKGASKDIREQINIRNEIFLDQTTVKLEYIVT
ncbi:MAG: transglutaminase-like domain-containing protein [Candidatus Hodarchaeales archaeon]|jgi:transglutaminase-like putative cysteine protease